MTAGDDDDDAAVVHTSVDTVHFYLLYASQTGQAESISEQIADGTLENEIDPQPHRYCISKFNKEFNIFNSQHPILIVFVTSTTGEGEVPETARKFMRFAKKLIPKNAKTETVANETLQLPLSHVSYAILGLGDTNYTNFCNGSRLMEKVFSNLGARKFYDTGYADDATGLEEVVEPWIDGLWPALITRMNELKAKNGGVSSIASQQMNEAKSIGGSSVTKRTTECVDSVKQVLVTSCDSTELLDIPKFLDSESYRENMNTLHSLHTSYSGSTGSLSVPIKPHSYLEINIDQSTKCLSSEINDWLLSQKYPSQESDVILADITDITRLTADGAVKTTLKVTLALPANVIEYDVRPGDSVGIITPNPLDEVDWLIHRLGLSDGESECAVSIKSNTHRDLPTHLPHTDSSSIRFILTYCCQIRAVVKKSLLRVLSDACSDESDRVSLLLLSSKQGSTLYSQTIRHNHTSLLEILAAYSSCKPSVGTILEHLPRLLPRPYSICNNPVATTLGGACSGTGVSVEIAFNVVTLGGAGAARWGVCTGWFSNVHHRDLTDCISALGIADNKTVAYPKVPMYIRTNHSFHPVSGDNIHRPVIMIGPGTGVAPFRGFLQHRERLLSGLDRDRAGKVGDCWLLYGCRHPDFDYIFRDELESFTSSGILSKLLVSYSRHSDGDGTSGGSSKYVQDEMRSHAACITSMLLDSDGILYVCGDAKGMAMGVYDTLVQSIMQEKGYSRSDSVAVVQKLQCDGQYKQDVWT